MRISTFLLSIWQASRWCERKAIMAETILTMQLLRDSFSVCRLDKGQDIPSWAYEGDFFSITKTNDELSIVCKQENVPDDVISESDWRGLKVLGPLDFSLIGILAAISKILAESGISIFAISTYDTDYILLKEEHLSAGMNALESNNYKIIKD